MEITSVFVAVNYRTGEMFREFIEGDGQMAINYLRSKYPRFTKFLLEGFEVDGNFVPLRIQ